jgi:hypothetical protein
MTVTAPTDPQAASAVAATNARSLPFMFSSFVKNGPRERSTYVEPTEMLIQN